MGAFFDMDNIAERIEACKRALAIANALRDRYERKKWASRIFVNLNKLRALQRKLKL